MAYMKEAEDFTPSKRAYQTQFKRWGFPSKQNPAHRNPDLVGRIKELWETNTTQRDMLEILINEGFQIKERELMRVRAKNRWLLRVPNGMKLRGPTEAVVPQESEGDTGETSTVDDSLVTYDSAVPDSALQPTQPRAASPELSPDVTRKRKERYEKLQVESDEKWAAKKRRRRTRGWAGLPADPAGPPRFPSETTIDESKQFLSLDAKLYREVRDHFQRICEDVGIVKKTIAGPERWQAAKDRLITENMHMQDVMWIDSTNSEAKGTALDVICTDVTKRMRTMERRMTIAEAKNILGVNPEQARQLRNGFYRILKNDHFTSKLEAGDGHWKELQESWINGSPLLQLLLADETDGKKRAQQLKALEVLCRDVMKRLRDDQPKRDSNGRLEADDNGDQDDGNDTLLAETANTSLRPSMHKSNQGMTALASRALARTSPNGANEIPDTQIDPSLLQPRDGPGFGNQDFLPELMEFAASAPVGIYIKVHPQSEVYKSSKKSLSTLLRRSVAELKQVVSAKWPDATITRIDGAEKGPNGQELRYLIEEDDELDAYLTHVQDRQATFVVVLDRP